MLLRRPSMLLALAIALLIAMVGAVASYTRSLPALGVVLSSTADADVKIQGFMGKNESQAATLALPAKLIALSEDSGSQTRVVVSGRSDLVRRVETEVTQADLVPQDRMAEIARTGSVRLWVQDYEGRLATLVRPVGPTPLPLTFWVFALTGLFGAVVGLWLLAMQSNALAARAAAVTGVALLCAALPMAVIDAAEFIIGGGRYALLLNLNYIAGQIFGAAFLCLFASYPIQLLPSRMTAIGCSVLGLVVVPFLFVIPTVVGRAQMVSALVTFDLVLILVALVLQWVRSSHDPAGRAYLRLVGTVTALSLGAWTAFFQLPTATATAPVVDLAFGFLLMLPPFVAIAVGIGKGHLFDLDRWAWKLLASTVVLLGLLLADLLLVLGVGLAPGPAASGSLFLVGTLWLLARNRFVDRIMGRRRTSPMTLTSDAVHVALAPTSAERFERWKVVLSNLFEPLEITDAETDLPVVATSDRGQSLWVPAPDFGHALVLRGARSGRSLFQREDCEAVTSLLLICAEVDKGRNAYDRGTLEERQRIARDLHDDVSAHLLTSLHRTDADLVRTDVRAAISDIRLIVAGLEGQQSQVEEVLATLRHDCCQRLEAARIECRWTLSSPAALLVDILPYQLHRALTAAVREAITNIIRHSQADRVDVAVCLDQVAHCRWLRLTIADNGVGIGPSASKGHGSRNIDVRMQSVGGGADYLPGDGTTIALSMPL